jgi:RNA polymerase sigma factor (sigma-70 family)
MDVIINEAYRYYPDDVADAQLVAAVKKDSEKYKLLFNKYYWRIRSFIYNRMESSDRHSIEDVKDLTMIVFERALKYIQENDVTTPFKVILYTISKNTVIKYNYRYIELLRQESPYCQTDKGEDVVVDPNEKTIEQKYIEDEFKAIVVSLLNKINKIYGDTGYMFFIDGYSEEEISKMLKLPKATIYKRIEICRNFIAKKLKNTRIKRCPQLKYSDEIVAYIKNNHATHSLTELHREVCKMMGYTMNEETLRKFITHKLCLVKKNTDHTYKNAISDDEKELIISSIGRLSNFQVMMTINENRHKPIPIYSIDYLRSKHRKLKQA